MADLRIPPGSQALGSQALAPSQPAARAEAIKAAQRAFFNAALEAQAQPVVKRAVATPTFEAPAPRMTATAVAADGPPPDRIMRPGSFLDIKV